MFQATVTEVPLFRLEYCSLVYHILQEGANEYKPSVRIKPTPPSQEYKTLTTTTITIVTSVIVITIAINTSHITIKKRGTAADQQIFGRQLSVAKTNTISSLYTFLDIQWLPDTFGTDGQ